MWYAVKNMVDCLHYGLENASEWQNTCNSNKKVVQNWAWQLREETGYGWVVVVSEYTYRYDG